MTISIFSNLLSIISSREFLSALLGGIFVLFGTCLTAHFENKNRKKENKDLIQSTLEAISTELEAALDRYQKTIGADLDKLSSDQPFNYYYSATENYLTIFDNNARLLGHIKNKQLRKLIIQVYINIKSLLDGFKLNNFFLTNYHSLSMCDQTNPTIQKKLQENDYARKNLASKLKQDHDELMRDIPDLLKQIFEAINSDNF